MKLGRFIARTALALLIAGVGASVANAGVIYTFVQITSNGTENIEAQLFVEVNDVGNDQVEFCFTNAVGTNSDVAEIYFDDGELLGIATITNANGDEVGDETGAEDTPTFAHTGGKKGTSETSPPNLPGGGDLDPPFEASAAFSVDSDLGTSPNSGLNEADDSVCIVFNLIDGATYQDVLDSLDAGLELEEGDDPTGTLRIGLHVRSIGTGGNSEGYINGPPDDGGGGGSGIPEPGSFVVWSVLAGAIAFAARRGRKA